MNEQQLEIWALQLSDYFIKKQRYQLISFNQETFEMWLFKPDEQLYPIISISPKPISQFNNLELQHHRLALSMLVKSEPKGLNLSVYPDKSEGSDTNISVMVGDVSHDGLREYYKGIENVLVHASNLRLARQKAMNQVSKSTRRLNQLNFYKNYRATTAVIIVTVLCFLLTMWFVPKVGESLEVALVMLGAYYKPMLVNAHEWWRLLTPMFFHASLIHLLMNLMALRNIASILEKEYGSLKFLLTLVLGVLFGSMFLYIRDEAVIGVGISGGIYALLGALFVNLYERGLFKNPSVLSNMVTTLLLNILISTLPGVSFTAHLGGFYLGVFMGFILSKRADWDFLRKASMVVLSLSFVIMIYLMFINSVPFEPSLLDVEVINRWYDLGFERYALRLRALLFGGSL